LNSYILNPVKFFRKKEVWLPTLPAAGLLLLLAGGLLAGLVKTAYPFLAQQHPVKNAEMVIIEGWLSDEELDAAAERLGPDQIIVTSGGPVTFARKILGYDDYAELCAARLVKCGVSPGRIIAVPAPDTLRDRTYVSAQAVRKRLEELGLFGKSADLFSSGPHARRSHLMYRAVFGETYPLGVISVEPTGYDVRRWYRSSEGFKSVVMEYISWAYAHLFLFTHHA
jgi:hypothetical protein